MIDDRYRASPDLPRPAAVLVPLVCRSAGLSVLLTERTAHLTSHAGQVAFPGGRTEPSDASPVATALRETEEEIGLHRSHIEVLGAMPQYLTGSGFVVTPVVGLVEAAAQHGRIIEAIERGDGDGAHAAMLAHVRAAREAAPLPTPASTLAGTRATKASAARVP